MREGRWATISINSFNSSIRVLHKPEGEHSLLAVAQVPSAGIVLVHAAHLGRSGRGRPIDQLRGRLTHQLSVPGALLRRHTVRHTRTPDTPSFSAAWMWYLLPASRRSFIWVLER